MPRFACYASCLIATIALSGSSAFAGMAKSLSYDLEYGSINAGSASTTSGSYSISSAITADGVAPQSVSSSSYSIEPVVGGPSGIVPVTISLMQLD